MSVKTQTLYSAQYERKHPKRVLAKNSVCIRKTSSPSVLLNCSGNGVSAIPSPASNIAAHRDISVSHARHSNGFDRTARASNAKSWFEILNTNATNERNVKLFSGELFAASDLVKDDPNLGRRSTILSQPR